jgi:hypothetical protein
LALSRNRGEDALRLHGSLRDRARSEHMVMNNFDSSRSLTLGQIELYILFILALAGVISKMLEAVTHSSGDFH